MVPAYIDRICVFDFSPSSRNNSYVGREKRRGNNTMITSLHFARALERQIEILRRSGKKAEKAVDQFQAICQYLRLCGPDAVELKSRRTRNGEMRVRNCIKYQLGHGYRLVTIRIGECLYMPFIGTHDEVDQWLDGRRREGFIPLESSYRRESLLSSNESLAICKEQIKEQVPGVDSVDPEGLAHLDEEVLRVVFHGLSRRPCLSSAMPSRTCSLTEADVMKPREEEEERPSKHDT